jgi:vancomycin resistance protein VanJ
VLTVVKSAHQRAFVIATLNLFAVILLYLAEIFVAERTWITTLFTYLPQMIFAVPTLVLLILSVCLRSWRVSIPIHLASALFFFFVVMPFTLAGFRVPRQSSKGGVALRVVTFNVEQGHAGADKIRSAISQLNADVLFLEESSPFASDHDSRQLLKKQYPYWAREESLTIISRFPLRNIRTHALPPGAPCLSAEIVVNGTIITVAAVHLLPYRYEPFGRAMDTPEIAAQSKGDWRYSTRRREPQIAALGNVLRHLPEPVIVGGDFNTPPRGRYYHQIVDQAGMRDTWWEVGIGFGYTLPARFPGAQVDHLLCRGDELTTQRTSVPAIPDASDHRPLIADFLVTAKR